jgi:hypothetical protein
MAYLNVWRQSRRKAKRRRQSVMAASNLAEMAYQPGANGGGVSMALMSAASMAAERKKNSSESESETAAK